MPAKRIEVGEISYPDGINGELKATQICMAAGGATESFKNLMGVSGLAFRLYFHVGRAFDEEQGRWNWGSLEVFPGEHPCSIAARLVGWTYTPHPRNTLKEMFELVRDSIEAGVPVVTRGPVGTTEPSIIVGYSEDEKRHVRKIDVVSKLAGQQVTSIECPPIDMAWVETETWRNPVGVLTRGEAPDDAGRREFLIAALKRAADAPEEPAFGDGAYVCGAAAYEALATSLEGNIDAVWDPDAVSLGDRDARVVFLGSLIGELGGARRIAAEFLAAQAETWAPLAPVAEAYAALMGPFENLRQAFPCPFTQSLDQATGALFSEPHRQAMAGWLRHMSQKEQEAAAELRSVAEGLS